MNLVLAGFGAVFLALIFFGYKVGDAVTMIASTVLATICFVFSIVIGRIERRPPR